MRSPFAYFRRNQKALLAFLTLAAMFTFTCVGFAGMGVEQLVRLLGVQPRHSQNPIVATTQWETIRYTDMYGPGGLLARRQLANEFAALARHAAGLFVTATYFGPADPVAIVDTLILRHKARHLGMRISDEAISQFIRNMTADRLTTDQFIRIRHQLQMTEQDLYDILRQELLAYYMRDLLASDLPPSYTPAQLWEYYHKLHDRVEAELVAVPAEVFLDQVEPPSDQQLQAYFLRYRDRVARPSFPFPGFKQPRRIQVEYLKADFDAMAAQMTVTDDEVRQFYEEHKDQRYYRTEKEPTEELPPVSSEEPAGASDEPPTDVPERDPSSVPESRSSEDSPEPSTEQSTKRPTEEPMATPAAEAPVSSEPSADEDSSTESDKPTEGEPRYRPLDQELADQIREELKRRKARERIEELLAQVEHEVFEAYAEKYTYWETDHREAPEKAGPPPARPEQDLKEFANQHEGVEYGLTPSISQQEAAELEGLGQARQVDRGGALDLQSPSFAQMTFQNRSLFQPAEARELNGNTYLFWKIADEEEHVPETLAEVRDQVERAWRLEQARQLARARAEQLAELAQQKGGSLVEALGGEPVTESDSQPLLVMEAGPFGWLSVSARSESPFAFRQIPELSEVPGVESAGEEFMRTVFGLEEGHVGVAPNAPETIWYVVRVKVRERAPRTDYFEADLPGRSRRVFTPYDELAQQASVGLWQHRIARLRQEAGLKWETHTPPQ